MTNGDPSKGRGRSPDERETASRFANGRAGRRAIQEVFKGEKLSLLEGIQESYGCSSAPPLETLVKETGGPWHQARQGFAGEARCGAIVSKESVKRHFALRLEDSRG